LNNAKQTVVDMDNKGNPSNHQLSLNRI